MNNERILSYKLSNKLNIEEISNISGGVTSSGQTYEQTHGYGGSDFRSDLNFDL